MKFKNGDDDDDVVVVPFFFVTPFVVIEDIDECPPAGSEDISKFIDKVATVDVGTDDVGH